MPKRRTLTQALAETRALAGLRERTTARASRAQREAAAPAHPSTTVYAAAMADLTEDTANVLERVYVGALSLPEAEAELLARVSRMHGAFARQARLVTTHARAEVGRLLNVQMPKELLRERNEFAQQQLALMRKVVGAQLAKVREYQLKERDIREAIWVTRNRGQLIARDQTFKYQQAEIREWAQLVGSEGYIYCTAGDERVRVTHRPHDGKFFTYTQPPSTGAPGTEPNCRCRTLPVEAATL